MRASVRRIARHLSTAATPSPPSGGSGLATVAVGVSGVALVAAGYYSFVDDTLGGLIPSAVSAPPADAASSSSRTQITTPALAESPSTGSAVALPVSPLKPEDVEARKERRVAALAAALVMAERADKKARKGAEPTAVATPSAAAQAAPAVDASQGSMGMAQTPAPTPAPTSMSSRAAAPAAPAPVSAAVKAVEDARADIRADLLKDVSSVLRREFHDAASAEVAHLDAPALRARLLRLLEDANDRARLEGIRLAEFLERSERAWLTKVRSCPPPPLPCRAPT